MQKQPFYITTTLPYVNGRPHIGHAMEFIRADTTARYKTLHGYDVFFNTGTDEHGQKIYDQAIESGQTPQEYVDHYAQSFRDSIQQFNLSPDVHFIRTTDSQHIAGAQEMWRRCRDNGFIYKKTYQAKYCVGCELEKTDSELTDGRCPVHPNADLQLIDEENYFFKFSAFQDQLIEFYDNTPDCVVPEFRLREIRSFVESGLQDFSISRLREKMSWGVPVPDDDDHVMYVWFDALTNYISTLGWPTAGEVSGFEKYWTNGMPVQYCGKDNLRQQTAMWQAMLMAAGLPNTRHVVINGFINVDGQKMSKSLGNVIDPMELVAEYGTDALRYYVLRHVQPFEDSDMTLEKFHELYNGNLANGLGNLVQRTMKMITSYGVDVSLVDIDTIDTFAYDHAYIDRFEMNRAMDQIWQLVGDLDKFITENQPYKKIKEDEQGAHADLQYLAGEIARLGVSLRPFMPETAEKIIACIAEVSVPAEPLFARKD